MLGRNSETGKILECEHSFRCLLVMLCFQMVWASQCHRSGAISQSFPRKYEAPIYLCMFCLYILYGKHGKCTQMVSCFAHAGDVLAAIIAVLWLEALSPTSLTQDSLTQTALSQRSKRTMNNRQMIVDSKERQQS